MATEKEFVNLMKKQIKILTRARQGRPKKVLRPGYITKFIKKK